MEDLRERVPELSISLADSERSLPSPSANGPDSGSISKSDSDI
jgi:hypothetical protein